MKRMYESVVIFDGSLPDETLTREQVKVEKFLQQNAEFERTDVWGKRTLAYEIKKKKSGYYCLFLFKGEGDIFEKLHNTYKLNQKILRHMTVLYEKEPEISKELLDRKSASNDSEEGEQ